jgi:hypothetical protein
MNTDYKLCGNQNIQIQTDHLQTFYVGIKVSLREQSWIKYFV